MITFLDVETSTTSSSNTVGEWEEVNDSLPVRRRSRKSGHEMEEMRRELGDQEIALLNDSRDSKVVDDENLTENRERRKKNRKMTKKDI